MGLIVHRTGTASISSVDSNNFMLFSLDGHSYERDAIQSWILSGKLTSPMTNTPMKHSNLTPNTTLKSVISRYFNTENVIT